MSNSIPEIKQTTIQIGDREYDGYKGPEGYYMNLSQVASILNKADNSILRVSRTKGFKALHGKDLTTLPIPGYNNKIEQLIDTVTVSHYLLYWVTKADPLAIQVMAELSRQNLDIRIENALGPIEPEKVAEMTGLSPD